MKNRDFKAECYSKILNTLVRCAFKGKETENLERLVDLPRII